MLEASLEIIEHIAYGKISKEALPEPKIMAARKNVVGTDPALRILATSILDFRCLLRDASSTPKPPR
jgi:hypothetical protein